MVQEKGNKKEVMSWMNNVKFRIPWPRVCVEEKDYTNSGAIRKNYTDLYYDGRFYARKRDDLNYSDHSMCYVHIVVMEPFRIIDIRKEPRTFNEWLREN